MTPEQILEEMKKLHEQFKAKVDALPDGTKTTAQIEALQDELDKKEKALSAKLAEIETRMNAAHITGGEISRDEEKEMSKKYFRELLAKGEIRSADVRKYAETKGLSTTQDTTGGYLCPEEFVREILKNVVEISPLMSYVTVRNTTAQTVKIPKKTGDSTATRVAEGASRSENTAPTYGRESVALTELTATLRSTNEELEDSAFNMEQELAMEAAEQFAKQEGHEIVLGTSGLEAEGFIINSAKTSGGIEIVKSETNDVFDADDIINLCYQQKTAYNSGSIFCANRLIIREIRKKKSDTGEYLWQPGLNGGQPATIMGYPVVEVPDMASAVADAAKVLTFGNFRKGYYWYNRISMTMIRDPYSRKGYGEVEFLFRKRSNGRVVLPEAIKVLEIE